MYNDLTFANKDRQRREDACRNVMHKYSQWRDAVRPIEAITPNSIRSLNLTRRGVNNLLPQGTKEIYYSFFVHELLRIARESGGT